MEPNMGVSLSIKNVPVEKVELLKQRAKNNHRSLQGELLALIDSAVVMPRRAITIEQLVENGRRSGLNTPDEATQWIREDRDNR